MACDCSNYIDCNDPKIEVGVYDNLAGYTHEYNNVAYISDLPFLFTSKVKRIFSVSYGWDKDINLTHVLSGCDGLNMECRDARIIATPFCTQSESCIMELNIPYHIDRQRGIYVWKHVKETLRWSISSNKTALFRLKWGSGYFHKVCIPTSVKTEVVETFYMNLRGSTEVMATSAYEYDPFPTLEGGGSTWGLYGNTISKTATPDTSNVACILLFPLVPKQAIPLDNDVIAYGFYDYNTIVEGFVESSLAKDDGGKDYFYPYWLRNMPLDSIWRSTADARYSVISSTGAVSIEGTSSFVPLTPLTNPYPFGSFCMDTKDNFIASCILEFGARSGHKGAVYNRSSFGDLFKALTDIGLPRKEFTKVDPVSLL